MSAKCQKQTSASLSATTNGNQIFWLVESCQPRRSRILGLMPHLRFRKRKFYEIVPQKDSTYGVRVSDGKSIPTVFTSFASEDAAKLWILEQKGADIAAGTYPVRRPKLPDE